jgi:hypothetical protein
MSFPFPRPCNPVSFESVKRKQRKKKKHKTGQANEDWGIPRQQLLRLAVRVRRPLRSKRKRQERKRDENKSKKKKKG